MIIVGLENCDTCKVFQRMHPEMGYIELPRRMSRKKDDPLRMLKIKAGKANLWFFPLVIDDALTNFISIREVDKTFAEEHPKLY